MNNFALSVNSHRNDNRHIVDQLADIREQLKVLKDREELLKKAVSDQMGSQDSLGGDEFIARQILSERVGSIDTKAMEQAGINPDSFRKAKTCVVQIRIERRVMEDC